MNTFIDFFFGKIYNYTEIKIKKEINMYPNALFSLFDGKYSVNLYGIFIGVCILACFIVYYVYTSKAKMDKDLQDFIFFVAIIAIVLGFLAAKLFQAVYNWIEDGYFNFASAGITVMGGFVGGALAFLVAYFVVGKFYFPKRKKDIHIKEFGKIFRIAPCCITIAHAIGRISCLMAGCCHGRYLGQEYVFGGIWMNPGDGVAGYYVPTQLYEALFLFALFAVLSVMFFKKSNVMLPVYLIAYAVWRFIIEFFRTDARGGAFTLGLAPSQWMSILFLVLGVGILVWYKLAKIPFTLKSMEENYVFFSKDKQLLEEDKTEVKEEIVETKEKEEDESN